YHIEYKRRRTDGRQPWYRITNWYRNGTIPYVYIIPKFKDLSKFRPLVSYFNHPLRNLFAIAGSAMTFMITQIPSQYRHFNLINPQLIQNFINDTNNKFKLINTKKIFPFMVDIKNMYTALKHKNILMAIYWLIGVTTNSIRGRNR